MSETPITTEEILQVISKIDPRCREYSHEFFQTGKTGHFYFSISTFPKHMEEMIDGFYASELILRSSRNPDTQI